MSKPFTDFAFADLNQDEQRELFALETMRDGKQAEEQKAQAKQVRLSHRETLTALRKDIRAKRREIHQSLQGGTFNEALVKGKLTEIAGLQTKVMAERHQMRQQLLALLTPEQKTTLDRMRQEFKARQAARRAAGV